MLKEYTIKYTVDRAGGINRILTHDVQAYNVAEAVNDLTGSYVDTDDTVPYIQLISVESE